MIPGRFISYESFWKQISNRLVWKSGCSQPASWLRKTLCESRTGVSLEFTISEIQQGLVSILLMKAPDFTSLRLLVHGRKKQTLPNHGLCWWDEAKTFTNLLLLLCTIHKHLKNLSRKRCVCYNVVLNKRPTVPCVMLRTILSTNPFNSQTSVKSVLIPIL